MKEYAAFDIGGTFIKHALVSENGEISDAMKVPTQDDLTWLIDLIVATVRHYQEKHMLSGIAISVPGAVQADGYLVTAGALMSLYKQNLRLLVTSELSLPVEVVNDGNAAAIAEGWIGNAKGTKNYVCIVLGTGVGGGVVVNGHIVIGQNGGAGEFGSILLPGDHVDVNQIGRTSWNENGAVVGSLVHEYVQVTGERINDARVILQRAELGEPVADKAVDRFIKTVAVGIINVMACLAPERIIIGGGISANAYFIQRLNVCVNQLMTAHASLASIHSNKLSIQPAKLQNQAGMLGAVRVLMDRI